MFQFQGGIADHFQEENLSELQKVRYRDVGKNVVCTNQKAKIDAAGALGSH